MSDELKQLERVSLSDALDDAMRSEDALMRFGKALWQDNIEGREEVTGGVGSPTWQRNWAISQAEHFTPDDQFMPEPIEPHTWSTSEKGRSTWGDNPPTVTPIATKPTERAAAHAALAKTVMDYIVPDSQLDEAWDDLYDYGSVFGSLALRWYFDGARQRVIATAADPVCWTLDRRARRNHRFARVAGTSFSVEAGEILALHSRFRDMLTPRSAPQRGGAGSVTLATGRDADESRSSGARSADRCVDVIELWIDPDPLPDDQRAIGGGDAAAPFMPARPVVVFSFVPGIGVLEQPRMVYTGRQIATAQWWRRFDHYLGRSDYDIVAGIGIAIDQLAIRGHLHRLAEFFPRVIVPLDCDIDDAELDGRLNPFLRPRDAESAAGIRILQALGINPQTLEMVRAYPDLIQELLGARELRPDFFDRQQTAYATAALLRAMENRMRQKIRNCRAMIEDTAAGMFWLFADSLAAPIDIPDGSGGVTRVDKQMLTAIDPRDIRWETNLGRPGPLSDQSKLAALQVVIESGAVDPARAMPLSMRDRLIDASGVEGADELKRDVREMLAAAAPQSPSNPNAPAAPNAPPVPSSELPAAAANGAPSTAQVLDAVNQSLAGAETSGAQQ